jgi:OmpA-like transmembrane domain.
MNSRLKATALGVVTVALLCAGATANAAEPEARGFYAGAMAGTTEFDDDGLCGDWDCNESDSGYGVFAGYKFLKYFAVEARYSDFGMFDATALSAHAVGIIPFGASGWEVFGQIGVGRMDDFETETVASAGLGVRFYPTPNLGFSLQTDAYVWEEYEDYYPGYGATQLAIHYLF